MWRGVSRSQEEDDTEGYFGVRRGVMATLKCNLKSASEGKL